MGATNEELRLLENIVTELSSTNKKLDAIIAGQLLTNEKLDQIIANTTPVPSDDISSLGGSISTPTKTNP
jgi:hypothetical protein